MALDRCRFAISLDRCPVCQRPAGSRSTRGGRSVNDRTAELLNCRKRPFPPDVVPRRRNGPCLRMLLIHVLKDFPEVHGAAESVDVLIRGVRWQPRCVTQLLYGLLGTLNDSLLELSDGGTPPVWHRDFI